MLLRNTLSGAAILSTVNQVNIVNPGSTSLRPMECPRPPAVLVDRDVERAHLDAVFAAGTEKGVLYAGMCGIGRISLIGRWVEDRANELFPDGVLFLNYDDYRQGSSCDIALAMRDKLLTLSADSDCMLRVSDANLANCYRSLTADKRLLVVLKNARSREEIVPFIPNSSKSMLVATVPPGYRGLPGDDYDIQLVAPLAQDAAEELFCTVVERNGKNPRCIDKVSLEKLLECCGGFPFAVYIAADAYCKDEKFLDKAVDYDVDRYLFSSVEYEKVVLGSLEGVGTDAEKALKLLVLFNIQSITIPSFSALCGCGIGHACSIARELAERSLGRIWRDGISAEGEWGLSLEVLAPVLSVVKRCWPVGSSFCEERDSAAARMSAYLRTLCEGVDWQIKPVRLRTYPRFEACSPIARSYLAQGLPGHAVIRREAKLIWNLVPNVLAPSPDYGQEVWPLGEALWSFYNAEHRYGAGIELLEACRQAADRQGEKTAVARNVLLQSNLVAKLGDFDRAQEMQEFAEGVIAALCSSESKQDLTMHSSLEEFWGGLETRRGNYCAAVSHYKSALQIIDGGLKLGYSMSRSKFLVLKAMGNAYRLAGNYDKASKCFDEALAIDDSVEMRSIVSCKLDYAELLIAKRDLRHALELASESVRYLDQSDERYRKARAFLLMARASLDWYEDASALIAAGKALEYYEKNGFEAEACQARLILDEANVTGVARLRRRALLHLGRFRRTVLTALKG